MAGLRKATRNDVAQVAARMGKTPFQEHMEKTNIKALSDRVAMIEVTTPEKIASGLTATGEEIAELRRIFTARIAKVESQIEKIEAILEKG